MLLIGTGQPLAALLAAVGQYLAAVSCGHPFAETVSFGSSLLAGLKCSFHSVLRIWKSEMLSEIEWVLLAFLADGNLEFCSQARCTETAAWSTGFPRQNANFLAFFDF